MKTLARAIKGISRRLENFVLVIDPPPPPPPPTEIEKEIERWVKDNGDITHRLKYDLNCNSVVFDIGGYEGQWTSDIFSMYQPFIYIFEPIKEFSDNICERFEKNQKIKVLPFGLSNQTKSVIISLDQNASSVYKSEAEKTELVQMVSISDFINKKNIKKIDLMKINIEGGEFDILEELIETSQIVLVQNIQVQFHEFVENAIQRRIALQNKLLISHELTYEYPFVWENWKIKN